MSAREPVRGGSDVTDEIMSDHLSTPHHHYDSETIVLPANTSDEEGYEAYLAALHHHGNRNTATTHSASTATGASRRRFAPTGASSMTSPSVSAPPSQPQPAAQQQHRQRRAGASKRRFGQQPQPQFSDPEDFAYHPNHLARNAAAAAAAVAAAKKHRNRRQPQSRSLTAAGPSDSADDLSADAKAGLQQQQQYGGVDKRVVNERRRHAHALQQLRMELMPWDLVRGLRQDQVDHDIDTLVMANALTTSN
ncbi:hypothetical protein RI367_002100 [Sorochytrium milnesiophthora]